MGTMAMDRETELARFMDSHKAQAQTQAQYGNMHDQNTSLQLNSDNIEEKRQRLRQERHQDWRMQQEKDRQHETEPSHLDNPPRRPWSNHEARHGRSDHYGDKYNQQKDQADMKLRQRQMIQTQNPPAVPPPGQVDYDGQADLSRQEQRKAYQDYQDGPVQPKPLLNYDENRRVLNRERKSDYNDLQRRKEQEMMDKKLHPPPPEKFSGLQIGEYDNYLKENGPKMKMQYKDMLDQQQKDDMFRRVKDEGAVLNRPPQQNQYGNPPSQYLANKPPPAPGHRMREDMADEERRRMDRNMGERQQEQAPIKKDRFYGAEQYEEYKKSQQKDLGNEYRGYLKEKFQPSPRAIGFPIGQYKYEPKRLALEAERNAEYNQLLTQRKDGRKSSGGPQGLPIGPHVYEDKKRDMERQRNMEYNELLQKMKTKENPRRTNAPQANGPYDGIFHGLGDRGNVQEHLTEERKSDFKQHLAKENQNYGPPARPDWALGVGEERGTHRGSPARNYDQGYDRPPPRDENRGGAQGGPPPPAQGGYRTPNYNDMLNDKRKEEAHRRRHDDPEYQMRLTSMDSRDRDNDREKMKDFQQQQPQRGY